MYTRTCARPFYIPFYYFIFLSTTDGYFLLYSTTDRTDECSVGGWEQNKNQINPLERMEGDALLLCFRSGLIRASS